MKRIWALWASVLCAQNLAQTAPAPDAKMREAVFEFVVEKVQAQYYDPKLHGLDWAAHTQSFREKLEGLNSPAQFYRHLNLMLAGLKDGHTRVIPKTVAAQQAQLQVNAGVRGLRIAEDNGRFFVREIVPGSPADQAGIKVGDRVVSVAGEAVELRYENALTRYAMFNDIQRKERALASVTQVRSGKHAVVQIERDEKPELIFIADDDFEPPTSMAFRMLDTDVSHLVLRRFRSDALPLYNEALDAQAPRGFVLDMRGNSGGDLAVAIIMADRWFSAPTVIAHERTRRAAPFGRQDELIERPWMAGGKSSVRDEPLAILIDEQCASACEVFAAAMKENKRARLFGQHSFGSVAGVALRPLEMPDGGGLNVSRIGIVSPQKNILDNRGVIPDELCPVTFESAKLGEDCALKSAQKWLAGQIAY